MEQQSRSETPRAEPQTEDWNGCGREARTKLERFARYVCRPAVSVERLGLTQRGAVHDRLKTPYRDGTTHLLLEPLDFLARLAALVPPSRVPLTRSHGVFAPHAALRGAITPAGRGLGAKAKDPATERSPCKHLSMTWAQPLKRLFAIDIERCRRCDGRLRVIASIEEPALIARLLAHLEQQAPAAQPSHSPFASRAPPQPLRL